MAEVKAVCISERKGTMKHEVPEIHVKIKHGIEGDAHAGDCHILPDIPAGAFAENILTEGITLYKLPIGTRLRVGEALLEVTQIGKECHMDCAIRKQVGDCVMPREGIFTVVVEEGAIKAGDKEEIVE